MAHALRRGGSRTNIAFVVHMVAGHDRLLGEQAGWLTAAGMRLRYLERTGGIVNLGMVTMNKFRVLQATEYNLVLFLDADILPLCNMDYMVGVVRGGGPVRGRCRHGRLCGANDGQHVLDEAAARRVQGHHGSCA